MIRNKKRKAEAAREAEAVNEADANSIDEGVVASTPVDDADMEPMSEVDEMNARIVALEAERDDAIGQYKRALADYHNYQKRSVQNERAASEYARQDVVRDLIPVLDNLDLAIEHGAGSIAGEGEGEGAAAAPLLQGVKMVQEALLQLMANRGVQQLTASHGDEFDPTRHEAVMMQPTTEVEPQHVLQMIQVGYQMNETVLRPTKVVIAQALPDEELGAETASDDENIEES